MHYIMIVTIIQDVARYWCHFLHFFFTCNQEKKNIAMDNHLNVDVKMVENMSRAKRTIACY